METKVCRDCGETKPLDDFHRCKTAKDGHQPYCKPCRLLYLRDLAAGRSLRDERRSLDGIAARFWHWVNQDGPEIIPGSPCWLWTGLKDRKGYGRFYFRGHITAAQRIGYLLGYGKQIPDELLSRHRCDLPACVRFDHIEPGTHHDNHVDMMRRGRSIKGRSQNPEKVLRGERHGRHTLTEEQVRDILRLHAEGVSNPELVRQFGMSATSIWMIVNRKTWKHLIV
jgi:hypothetical protein